MKSLLDNFLCGEFKSTLDVKGRMNFPVKLREIFGECFVISKALDAAKCLNVYTVEEWKKLEGKVTAMPQIQSARVQRFIFGSAFDIEPDKQGRILIPAPLRDFAELSTDVVIVGLSDHAEIWDKAKWDDMNASANIQSLAEEAMALGL